MLQQIQHPSKSIKYIPNPHYYSFGYNSSTLNSPIIKEGTNSKQTGIIEEFDRGSNDGGRLGLVLYTTYLGSRKLLQKGKYNPPLNEVIWKGVIALCATGLAWGGINVLQYIKLSKNNQMRLNNEKTNKAVENENSPHIIKDFKKNYDKFDAGFKTGINIGFVSYSIYAGINLLNLITKKKGEPLLYIFNALINTLCAASICGILGGALNYLAFDNKERNKVFL